MPAVSVIVPAYNAMPYLKETVESVLNQTYTDFELLIINDGSTDTTSEWVSQVSDPRVKLISQNQQGVATARNKGIKHAQGEYIAFLDADDLWISTKLEKQIECLEKSPAAGLASCWINLIDEHGNLIGDTVTVQLREDTLENILLSNFIFCGSTPVVRRRCFETVGQFDQSLAPVEDWDMWIRIAFHYSFAIVKEPLLLYRQHPQMSSRKYLITASQADKVIAKSFQSAPSKLHYLKSTTYANFYLYIAKLALEAKNYKHSLEFIRKAVHHQPHLRLTDNYKHLKRVTLAKKWLGPQGYFAVQFIVYIWRSIRNQKSKFLRIVYPQKTVSKS